MNSKGMNIGALLVSKMIIEENKKPRFMYREKPMNANDSGWRIFSGYENEEYTDNEENIGIYSPESLIKIDSTLIDILKKGLGSVYERLTDESPWYKVTDFPLEDSYLKQVQLTKTWSFSINNLFLREMEEGAMKYTTGDKTLRILAWNSPKNKDELSIEYKNRVDNRDQTISKTLKTFELSDEKIYKLGYMITGEDDNREYSELHAFSIIDKSILYTVFYFDDSADSKWAISTWKSINAK
ncbi:DUF2185 domain-containing protein [Fusobacterium sp. PH5-44]|uniref:DUF2185 domain-containing protein n=1 Tax=unclassified Fusobacterium TaxID=2648384 RepID=UPI003D1ABC69